MKLCSARLKFTWPGMHHGTVSALRIGQAVGSPDHLRKASMLNQFINMRSGASTGLSVGSELGHAELLSNPGNFQVLLALFGKDFLKHDLSI